jgi:hypothetical protein
VLDEGLRTADIAGKTDSKSEKIVGTKEMGAAVIKAIGKL